MSRLLCIRSNFCSIRNITLTKQASAGTTARKHTCVSRGCDTRVPMSGNYLNGQQQSILGMRSIV
eukprot:211112-Pyramimonas_sp.AAC.1